MMATESPKGRSDEATLTSATEPTIKIDSDSQNADLGRPHINGAAAGAAADEVENKHISDIIDDLVNSAEVSISGGSDNEASKADSVKGKDDGKGHGRTSSAVKKPASFKAISVNKTFLTTKGAAPQQSKAAEKPPAAPGTTTTPSTNLHAARPRLVAKTGSGLIAKSSSGANGGKPGSAPDPNAVWNKNRPVPPPEPKKYTDEELKKYGIHMANRLHPDDAKGQANWADIEDDDEDWAPETITWQDGTKITIPHHEEAHPTPPEPEPAPAPPPALVARPAVKENGVVDKAKLPAPVAPPPLKPSPGVLGSGKGLVLKGAPEKPTLVAKPPPPSAPAKSPWAPLPKVDRISPVAVEPPNQQQPPRFPPRDAGIQKSNTPPPPKEIAADDFSRAPLRDGPPHGNRELFDSRSGRYEPVDRRGPPRPEHHGRQPALLQRPHHEQQPPVEPAGLHLARNEPEFLGRRRGSSNVSGGSGTWFHRPPVQPPELITARRGSTAGVSDGPASPRNFSPSGLSGGPRHGQGWPPRGSPSMAHATLYHQGAPPNAQPAPPVQPAVVPVTEQDYEEQKKLMKERRELAMKRRRELEEKEEAERKERIRLKLEALGPPPEPKSAKKTATREQSSPAADQAPEGLGSQPSPSVGKARLAERSAPPSVPSDAGIGPDTTTNSNAVPGQTMPSPDSAEMPPHSSSHAHPWSGTTKPADRHPAASWGVPPAGKNVWGPPNNNRSLGNGTFTSDQTASQLPAKPGPGPIAPPTSRTSHTETATPAMRQPPIGPPKSVVRNEQTTGTLSASALEAVKNSFTNAPVIKDTWRPTKLNDKGVRIDAAPKHTIQLGAETPWGASADAKPTAAQQPPSVSSAAPSEFANPASSTILGGQGAAPPPLRGSRFFPQARDSRQGATEVARPKSPSPPPPDMAGHPAFDGDVTHPQVSLPRPQPVVRLPPAPAAASDPAAQPPSFAWAHTAGYKEHEAVQPLTGPAHSQHAAVNRPTNSWQTKINMLLGVRAPHSPPKSTGHHDRGEPSLTAPPLRYVGAPYQDGSIISKGMAEECFEEQEMGSLPPVRLPHEVSQMAWQPSPAPKPLPRKLFAAVSSAEPLAFPLDMSGSGSVWRVSFPGSESKTIVIPPGRTRSNPRQRGQRGGQGPRSDHRGGKSREGGSAGFSSEQGQGTGANPRQARNNRGGYRGRDTWSRSPATPIQT